MRFTVPKHLQDLYIFSIPLFIIHVMEEFITLYYPQFFGISYRQHNLPMDKFLTIEIVVITGMITAAYLIKKKLIPLPLMILPGLFYLYQVEHIQHTIKLQAYYPGTFTGIVLFVFALYYWKEFLGSLWKKKTISVRIFWKQNT